MKYNNYILKYKSPNEKFKLGSVYFEKKENKKKYYWCLHKDCILFSEQCFENKLDLLEHCRKCH